MRMVFLASMIRHRLCIIYPFFDFCSKIIFNQNSFFDCCDRFDYLGSIVYLSCLICYSFGKTNVMLILFQEMERLHEAKITTHISSCDLDQTKLEILVNMAKVRLFLCHSCVFIQPTIFFKKECLQKAIFSSLYKDHFSTTGLEISFFSSSSLKCSSKDINNLF